MKLKAKIRRLEGRQRDFDVMMASGKFESQLRREGFKRPGSQKRG